MFHKFGMQVAMGLCLLFSPDALAGVGSGKTTVLIPVRKLLHSKRNMELRSHDNDKGALAKQQTALQASITRGKGWKAYTVADFARLNSDGTPSEAAPNWLASSVFRVEPASEKHAIMRPGVDLEGAYAVLGGSHRLEALENAVKENPAWLDFQVPCTIYTPDSDAERDMIIVKDNNDGPEAGTVVKMSPVTRFQQVYSVMPRCDYVCEFGKDGKTPQYVSGTPKGWSSADYWRETGIGGVFHVPFSCLTRLGRHFDIPVEVFNANRLRIKSQVTAALLTKTTEAGKGSDVVSQYGYGFELRYMVARAEAHRTQQQQEVKDAYRLEFLELLNINFIAETGAILPDVPGVLDGGTALGGQPEMNAEEKKEAKASKTKADAEKQQQVQRSIANAPERVYAFAKWAVGNAFALPEYPPIDASVGNALDLLFSVTPDAFKVSAIPLAEYKRNPSNAKNAVAAARAIIDALETLPGVISAQIADETAAAHGKPNTPKKKK